MLDNFKHWLGTHFIRMAAFFGIASFGEHYNYIAKDASKMKTTVAAAAFSAGVSAIKRFYCHRRICVMRQSILEGLLAGALDKAKTDEFDPEDEINEQGKINE
jgi:hypothetical protein